MLLHGKEIKKALTLRASSLGDALMGKYFLENIHAAFPRASLTLLIGSRKRMIADLLAGYPWLTVVEVNRRQGVGLFRAWKNLRGQDITLTQYSENPFSLPSKLFARLVTKRGGLLGFSDRFFGNRWLYDQLVLFEGEKTSKGMIVEEQRALSAARIPLAVTSLGLSYIQNPAVLDRFGLTSRNYIVAHLFSGNEGRSVSQTKRIEIVRMVRAALPPEELLVLTGVTNEYARATEAAGDMRGTVVLAGKTSMQEMINIIAQARHVIALDSGAAHIAGHLKIPLTVLTRHEARQGWWSDAMYNGQPIVLTNERANDTAPRKSIYPPSMEGIEISRIIDTVITR